MRTWKKLGGEREIKKEKTDVEDKIKFRAEIGKEMRVNG